MGKSIFSLYLCTRQSNKNMKTLLPVAAVAALLLSTGLTGLSRGLRSELPRASPGALPAHGAASLAGSDFGFSSASQSIERIITKKRQISKGK